MTEVGTIWSGHSHTFFHDEWPCDIDVHRYFPGFLSAPNETFSALWDTRETATFGHRVVEIPSGAASILISGLHQLRDGRSRERREELRELKDVDLGLQQQEAVLRLAMRTGAVEPMRDLLIEMGFAAELMPPPSQSANFGEWKARITADGGGIYFWYLLLERAPLRDRPGIVARALWPPRDDLLRNLPATQDSLSGRFRARLGRLVRGVAALSRSLSAIRSRPRRDT